MQIRHLKKAQDSKGYGKLSNWLTPCVKMSQILTKFAMNFCQMGGYFAYLGGNSASG